MENPPALSAFGQACLAETDPENCDAHKEGDDIAWEDRVGMIAEDACYFDSDTDVISGSCAGLSSDDCAVEVILIERECQWYDMSKPEDDGEYRWIYEDCCDIELNYVPPTEKGDEWCAATGGAEFYMGVNVEDGAVVPIIPCEYYALMEECEDTSFTCDEAIVHCGTPGTDSFSEDCAWATDIVTDTCCQAVQPVFYDECGCAKNPACDAAWLEWSACEVDLDEECPAACNTAMANIEAACNMGDASPLTCEHMETCWESGSFMNWEEHLIKCDIPGPDEEDTRGADWCGQAPSCDDDNSGIAEATDGGFADCGALEAYVVSEGGSCEDDSFLVNSWGVPAGWFAGLCPATCGCIAAGEYDENGSWSYEEDGEMEEVSCPEAVTYCLSPTGFNPECEEMEGLMRAACCVPFDDDNEDDNDEHHCSSGLQDEDETGIDCGGASCDACVVAHCADYIQNEDETGTDCGGADCG
ncbi:hypothetical protein TeGR_g1588 [Tetraparma gracilis]|uniref:Uncharacterized protein n=1 Tax=Tetraparma gracilis TaxID=2962635 RepID=A0ABQ6N6R4_9STRA|nr:hypothetical protein TeGR_g1588 [Tetraparma gracilis]